MIPSTWPLPPGAITHPRTAGCFSRALRLWRDEGAALADAVRRCTLLPAQVLERCVPAMRRKGRLQAGADADVVVFDPDRISDQASYAESTRPSAASSMSSSTAPSSCATGTSCSTRSPVERYAGCRPSDVAGARR